ncbi:MAG: hypothetical protein IAE83_06620 [Anaerolinea sp.]|nr:hypothetical protein [Anaerolinea sp.]
MKRKSPNGKPSRIGFFNVDSRLIGLLSGLLGLVFTIGIGIFILARNTKRYDGIGIVILAVAALLLVSAQVSRLVKLVKVKTVGHWLKEIGLYANEDSRPYPFDNLPADTRRIRPYAVLQVTLPTTLTLSFRLASENSTNHFHFEQSYDLDPGRHVISPPGWFQLLEPRIGDGWRYTVSINGNYARGHKVFISEETSPIQVNEDGEISPRLRQAVEGTSSDLSLDDLLNQQQSSQNT